MYSNVKKIGEKLYVELPSNRIGEIELIDGDRVIIDVNENGILITPKNKKETDNNIGLSEKSRRIIERMEKGYPMGEYRFKREDAYEGRA